MKPCHISSPAPVATDAVPIKGRPEATVRSTQQRLSRRVARQPPAATTPIGDSAGANTSTHTAGVSAASVPPSLTTSSPSRRRSRSGGHGSVSMRMTTWCLAASLVIRHVLRAIRADGVGKTVKRLTAPKRTHSGGGSTILPPGHHWKRHEGARARQRRLRQEHAQIQASSRADLEQLERRYRKLTGRG